jgi:hypothetical protein
MRISHGISFRGFDFINLQGGGMAMINPVLEKFALPSQSDNRFGATPGLIFFLPCPWDIVPNKGRHSTGNEPAKTGAK